MLFEAVTKRADREKVKCYLESSKKVPNVMIYEKMGFEMKMEMECRDGEDACMVSFTFLPLSFLAFFLHSFRYVFPLLLMIDLDCFHIDRHIG